MPAFTAALGLLGLGTSVAGGIMSYMGQQKQITAEENIASLNQQQMLLDAARQRRDIARKAIIARGTAISNATNSGAGYGGSSGVAGGVAGIANQANSATLASNQNTAIANNIFGQQYAGFQGASQAATGMGLSGLGGSLMNMGPMFGKIGGYMSGGGNFGWGTSGTWGAP